MNADPVSLLLELDAWDAATSDARRSSALAIAETLPSPFVFEGLSRHTLGGRSHEIASFTYDGAAFALIPGSRQANLGYDRSRPFQLPAAHRDDWQFTQDENGTTLDEYLDHYLTARRRAHIAPMLAEVSARSFQYAQDGDDQSEGYGRIQSECGEGFRLPTPDEWEYLCAAGTESLFRWGNEFPTSNSYDEKTWHLHRLPNAFGVMMNSSTYDSELCAGPEFRGGDGGGSVCGGMGNVASWLPLASSFQVSDDEVAGWWIDEVLARRLRPVVRAATGSL